MKKLLIVTSFVLLIAAAALADLPVPPRIDARLSLDVPDNIELNTPFEVTFTFETLEVLNVEPDKPDRAVSMRMTQPVARRGSSIGMETIRNGFGTTMYKLIEAEPSDSGATRTQSVCGYSRAMPSAASCMRRITTCQKVIGCSTT